MRTEHPIEAISAFLDGALEPAEADGLERHLSGCGSCARLLEDLRTLEAAREDPPPVPAGLHRRIARSLEPARAVPMAPPPPRRAPWLRGIPLAAAGSMAAVAVLAVFLLVEPERVSEPGLLEGQTPAPLRQGSRVSSPEPGRDDSPPGSSTGGSGEGEGPGAKARAESDLADGVTEGPETATKVPAPEEPAPRSRQKVVKEQPPPATFAPVPSTLEKEAAGAAMPAPEDKNEAPKPLSSESRLGEERRMTLRRDATRMIVVEAPDYVITLHETGLMRITSGEYDCAVVPENGAGKEVTAIFKTGAGKATPDQRDDILDLLDRGYRDLFRRQCGPLPEALGKDE